MKKQIITILIALAVLTGLFFYTRYQIALYKTVVAYAQLVEELRLKVILLEDFTVQNFPDEVKTFNETLKAK